MAKAKLKMIPKRKVLSKQPVKGSSLRASVLASVPAPRSRSWYDELLVKNPGKANEIRELFDEWQDEGTELRRLFPTKTQLALAVAKEIGNVSKYAVVRLFNHWVEQ